MGGLRDVLAAVTAAPPGTGLDEIARRLGLGRDEVDAMVDFWVRRGELTVESLRGCSTGCPATTRSGCSVAGGSGCPATDGSGGGLLAIRRAR